MLNSPAYPRVDLTDRRSVILTLFHVEFVCIHVFVVF